MNEKEFCYWLQGFFELTDSNQLSEAQVKMIKEHLALVFKKTTSPLEKPTKLLTDAQKKADEVLDEMHKRFKNIRESDLICGVKKYC